MSDERPEAQWAPLPAKPRRRGATWLIVVLGAAVVAAALLFIFVVLPHGFRPEPAASPTASTSPSPSPTVSTTPSPTPSPTPVETSTSVPTPPPVPDPPLSDFASRVAPILDDARRGLDFAAEDGGEAGAESVLLVLQDAERLHDTPAPDSIATEWSSTISAYIGALDRLQNAYRSGGDTSQADDAARAALNDVRALVGLD